MMPTEKILIVDDDKDILVSLRELFEQHGFDVTTVESGWECLKELQKGFHGIILLDLMMPGMDGVETMHQMVLEGFMDMVTIVILTAKKVQDAELDEYYPYIYEYVTKPFDVNHLLSVINKIVEERSQRKSVPL